MSGRRITCAPPAGRRRALAGALLALLFALRALGAPAHLALAHGADPHAHGHEHGHSHDHDHAHHPEPAQPDPDEHSAEDHQPDLLAQRSTPRVPPVLAPVAAWVELAPARSWTRSRPPRAPSPPRARSPAPPALRGPPAA